MINRVRRWLAWSLLGIGGSMGLLVGSAAIKIHPGDYEEMRQEFVERMDVDLEELP